jgi:4-amino-4-deoxy-L-arabinose transferase-like glycosyltransferase
MINADSVESSSLNRLFGLVFVVLLLLAIANTVRTQDLWFADEARVGGIAIQMADRNLYSVPYLGTEPFVEKPPLYFISAALAYRLFGEPAEPAWALRLASLFWGLLAAAACGGLATTLAQRYPGVSPARHRGWLPGVTAALLLFIIPGFINNALTIRVDIALVFFYIASLLCICRWVFYQRLHWLYAGALMLSLAFMSKGIIGPALVACSTLALSPEILRLGPGHWRRHGWHYLLATGVFVLPVSLWLALMYRHGGSELLSFWLFDNQLNRFTGGGSLGHESSGQFFYYLGPLAEYLAPWLPFFLAWVATVSYQAVAVRTVAGEDRLLLLMLVLPLLLLSAASTKRPVYLIPLLPLCAVALTFYFAGARREVVNFAAKWLGLACVLLTMLAALLSLLPLQLASSTGRSLDALNTIPALAILLFGPAMVALQWQLRCSWKVLALGTAYIVLLLSYSYYPANNAREGQHQVLQDFFKQLSPAQLDQTAGRNLSEPLRGYIYAHSHRAIELLDREQLIQVLLGRDERYRCALYSDKPESGLPSYRVLARMPATAKEPSLALICAEQQ